MSFKDVQFGTPEEYIVNELNKLNEFSEKKLDLNSEKDLADFIAKIVVFKKFRKFSVDEKFPGSLEGAIKINLEKKEPIKFCFPFGGYKLWRLEESPEVDWAELFALIYYANWLKPICENYGPGVWFDFSSDDVIVEMLDNIPAFDTEKYRTSFLALISFIEQYLPKNMKFTFTPVGSRYTKEEFEIEIKDKMENLRKNLGGLPEVSEKEIKMIDLNTKPREGEKRDLDWYRSNKLTHDAYMSVDKRRPYNRAPEKILVFTTRLPSGVAVGTTKTSVAKFWVGVGALIKRGNGFIETILSPDQLQKTKYKWESVLIDGLKDKNFEKLRVI